MKTIITFVAGALLASGLVYFMMSRNSPPPATAKVETTVGPVPAIPEPAAEPEPAAAPPPQPRHKPAMTSGRKSPRREPAPVAPAAAKSSESAPAPAETAKNEPPANPTGGPMIPSQPVAPPPPPPEEKKREPKTVTIPSGTLLTVRVDEALSTSKNKTGDSFRATLDQPLVIDSMVIAERGSRVEGRVIESDPGGRVRGLSQLQLELVRLNTSDGQRLKLATESFSKEGQKETGKDIAKVGAAAGIGAAIGAIAGGGKGAGLGAIIGGAAGTGGVMATRGAAAQVAAETRVSFRLREPITVTERLN